MVLWFILVWGRGQVFGFFFVFFFMLVGQLIYSFYAQRMCLKIKPNLFCLAIYQESKTIVFCYPALLSGYEQAFIVLYLQSPCMS